MKNDIDQEKASDCLKNHSLIIAGAGCGKTTTLLKKIEKIISSGVNEKEILAISFTNETVNNLKEKCKYNIKISTFHKLALEYIKEDYDIADEYIIYDVIRKFLKNIPDKLKKYLYYRFSDKTSKYSDKRYEKTLLSDSSTSLSNTLKNICKIIKTNNVEIKNLQSKKFSKTEKILIYCATKILNIYQINLEENNLLDFDDIIIKATHIIKNTRIYPQYKHILVDEYQDISFIREKFLEALANKNNAILTVVGDDWQSIYRFSGSNISLFLDFEKRYKNAKKYFIQNTYRCPQKIINISTKFILKNKMQIKKTIISNNNNKGIYKKIYTMNNSKCLYKILTKIPENKEVLILSRNNYDINNYTSKRINYVNNKFIIDGITKENIRFMTIHSAKGLEADVVIIINLTSGNNGLPSSKVLKIEEKLIDCNESIRHAEERRLFYVALTRTKSDLYMIINKKNSSIFVNET